MLSTLPPPDEIARGDFEMVVRRLADDLAFGMDTSRFVGSGLEFAQSRPYEPGDPVKSMDWRLTARLGKPFVKEHETLKRTALYLVVDTSASMSVASSAISKHDLAIWIAAAVGLLAQRRMSPVAIVGGGERTTRVEPSLLRGDLWRTLEPLRTAQLDEGTRLAERLRELDLRIARTSVVLVLSDLHDPGSIEALRQVAQRHDCIAIHLVDPAERGSLGAGFFRGAEAETGRTFTSHGRARWNRGAGGGHGGSAAPSSPPTEDLAIELARGGVATLRLQSDLPFVAALRHFLSFRPAIGGGRG